MFKTPPSWSIPGKYPQSKNENTPSPCGYDPNKWQPTHSPSWKIGKSQRNKQNKQLLPGPGYYEPRKSDKNTKFGKFNNEISKKNVSNENPSPNKYSPNYRYNRPASPQLSISGKPKQSKAINIPGPGSYETTLITKKGQVNVKIGGSKRFMTQKLDGPGPQSYNPLKNNFKKISIAFTKQNKSFNDVKSNIQANAPGPGSYGTKDTFDLSLQYKRGFSMSSKHKTTLQDTIPGPGQYTPIYSTLPQSPQVSMKGSHVSFRPQKTPGPSQYYVKQFRRNTCYGYSIGKCQRTSTDFMASNPGPGSYNPKKIFQDTPKYSLCGSRIQEYKTISPGPGAYNADRNCIKKRPQSAKIGKSARCQNQKQNIPGPGSYQFKPRPSTPCTSFTKQQRGKNQMGLSPGPGSYNIQPIIGQCASYSSKQK